MNAIRRILRFAPPVALVAFIGVAYAAPNFVNVNSRAPAMEIP
jgi:hypothetical protein